VVEVAQGSTTLAVLLGVVETEDRAAVATHLFLVLVALALLVLGLMVGLLLLVPLAAAVVVEAQ
jgi:hypothetical protein